MLYVSHQYEVYDFLEFVASNYERYQFKDKFIASCNQALEKEISAYRFVDGLISRITEQQEVDEIERSLETALDQCELTSTGLELLSSRETPDYRNSIKESPLGRRNLIAFQRHRESFSLAPSISPMAASGFLRARHVNLTWQRHGLTTSFPHTVIEVGGDTVLVIDNTKVCLKLLKRFKNRSLNVSLQSVKAGFKLHA